MKHDTEESKPNSKTTATRHYWNWVADHHRQLGFIIACLGLIPAYVHLFPLFVSKPIHYEPPACVHSEKMASLKSMQETEDIAVVAESVNYLSTHRCLSNKFLLSLMDQQVKKYAKRYLSYSESKQFDYMAESLGEADPNLLGEIFYRIDLENRRLRMNDLDDGLAALYIRKGFWRTAGKRLFANIDREINALKLSQSLFLNSHISPRTIDLITSELDAINNDNSTTNPMKRFANLLYRSNIEGEIVKLIGSFDPADREDAAIQVAWTLDSFNYYEPIFLNEILLILHTYALDLNTNPTIPFKYKVNENWLDGAKTLALYARTYCHKVYIDEQELTDMRHTFIDFDLLSVDYTHAFISLGFRFSDCQLGYSGHPLPEEIDRRALEEKKQLEIPRLEVGPIRN